MHVALTVWQEGLATVADFAPHLLLVEVVDGQAGPRRTVEAPGRETACWSARLAAAGVGTLLCGAISRYLSQRLAHAGITVIAGCSGSADAVLVAWLTGTLTAQPGDRICRRRRQRGDIATSSPSPIAEPNAMRLAFTTTGPGADAPLDPRFGRCRHILVGDSTAAALTHHPNPVPAEVEHGAGIRTAEFVASLGVQGVVTGAVGPKAMQVLRAAGIRAYACEVMPAHAALNLMRDGKLTELT